MDFRIRSRLHNVLAGLLALGVVALFAFQVAVEKQSAGRRIGLTLDEDSADLVISALTPGLPGERDGLEPGDRLLAVDGKVVRSWLEYQAVAAGFERGRPVLLQIERDGARLEIEVRPGAGLQWGRLAIEALLLLSYLGLGLLAFAQRADDVRARLLFAFSTLLALEIALPLTVIGQAQLSLLAGIVFYAITGAQLGVELHLASVVPQEQQWLARRSWVVPGYYAVGIVLAVVLATPTVAESLLGPGRLPWSPAQSSWILRSVGLPLWALGVSLLLARAALSHSQPEGRHQAALVLLGVLPWGIYAWTGAVFAWLGEASPLWLDTTLSWLLLAFPVAVFFAISRYQLFDLELVVRRGMLYTLLTGSMVLVFYALVGTVSVLLSGWLDVRRHSLWVVSAITLLLGLLFAPLRRSIQNLIERRFFPERQVLRRRLADLAAELPALGKVPRMAEHLVVEICESFKLHWAELLLAEPRSGTLRTAARHRSDEAESPVSLLVASQDPGIELLRQIAQPLEPRRLAAVSAQLGVQLELLDTALVVPLVSRERLVGLLLLGRRRRRSRGHRLPSEELELLGLLAHHVAIVFENVRLFESATYESLTGLLRREGIVELLDKEMARALRYERPLTVGLADLDHFKSVNDRHGHLAGDALLKHVAEELAASIRSTDALGRYGGEEFLLVFPETDLLGAAVVAEKIRSRIETLRVPLETGEQVSVRISIGLASFDDLPRTMPASSRALIDAADRALYRAKGAGRNRVEPAVAVAGSVG